MKNRFEQVHYETLDTPFMKTTVKNISIVKDTETGVMYGMTMQGIFPLLDTDGKPLLEKPEE